MSMSLDCWLAQKNPQICPPPFKKTKTNTEEAVNQPSLLPHPKELRRLVVSSFPHRKISFPERFSSRLASQRRLNDIPPEYVWGRRSLHGWSVSDRFQGSEHIVSLECIPGAPLAVLGLDNGEIDMIECSSDPTLGLRNENVGRCKYSLDLPPNWPIVDISALSTENIACASKRGISFVNIASGQVTGFKEQQDEEITHITNHNGILAVSGSGGSIDLIDHRDLNTSQNIVKDAHSVRKGPLANRQRPGISALTWVNSFTLASGSQSNETVKFWDIRNARRSSMMSNWDRSGQTKLDGGINSLRSQGDSSVWALSRGGHLLKLNAGIERPEYRLNSPGMKISSPYQSFDLIPGGGVRAGHYNSHTQKNMGPLYPLIASCSDKGVMLITEPSEQADLLEVDSTYASLLSANSISPLPAKATSVRWHPYTQELVSVIGNRGWELWACENSGNKRLSKPVSVKMSSHGAGNLRL